MPFVAFGRPWGALDNSTHHWLDVDGGSGTEAAARRCVPTGTPASASSAGLPAPGSATTAEPAGGVRSLTFRAGLELGVFDGAQPGAEAATELLARGATALVCASDSLALGALTVCRDLLTDARLPLIGFDDTPVARALGLSSIHQPVELAAEELIGMVVDILGGRTPPHPQQMLFPELVLRHLAAFAQ